MEEWQHLFWLLLGMVAFAFVMRRHARRNASLHSESARELHSRKLAVAQSPEQAWEKLKRLPDEARLQIREETWAQGLLLEGQPGLMHGGYFFPVRIKADGARASQITVGCRPRLPMQAWHLWSRREHVRACAEIKRALDQRHPRV